MGLDMYLTGDKFTPTHDNKHKRALVDGYEVESQRLALGQWRKNWALHDFISEKYGDGESKVELKDEELLEIADLSDIVTFALNDMIRSKTGVSFVASVNFRFGEIDPADAPNSPLMRVDSKGNVSIASDETRFPNGMAIPPDGKRLIVADSLSSQLRQWDLAEDGSLSNHRIFATIPGSVPDGGSAQGSRARPGAQLRLLARGSRAGLKCARGSGLGHGHAVVLAQDRAQVGKAVDRVVGRVGDTLGLVLRGGPGPDRDHAQALRRGDVVRGVVTHVHALRRSEIE